MTLTPLNGFAKKVADLPDRPNASMTSAEVKAQFDAAAEELRVFLNSKLAQIDTDFSLKSEIASALLGQILDGSLTDIKLSNTAGQIKERLSSFIATKGQPGGLAELGANGLLKISIKTGAISSGGTIPKTTGYTSYIYFVSINNVTLANTRNGSLTNSSMALNCSVDQLTRVVTINSNSDVGTFVGTANYIEIAW